MNVLALAFAVLAALPAMPAAAQTAPRPDYGRAENWLCRPGSEDACDADQSATIVAADGKQTIEPFRPSADPKFDCFYVYPTVSLDPTPNSDMVAGPEEKTVAAFQAGRFAAHCRVFAPLYRQVTLTALRAIMTGKPSAVDRDLAFEDVKAAWEEYLEYDNHGRGVVLIGHSQGSLVLTRLIAQAIEGTPAQKLVISAILAGTNVALPEGKEVGGDLQSTPPCRRATDTGCFVSWVSFRADAPPPAGGRFGSVDRPGMVAACVDAAALMGHRASSDAYLGARGAGLTSKPMGPWTRDGATITTPFVKVPGLIGTACATSGKGHYLAVTVHGNPADARTDTIVGDIWIGDHILADWGLHLIDMPVVMGDLVALTDVQAKAWAAKK